jgi:hypothetical protein
MRLNRSQQQSLSDIGDQLHEHLFTLNVINNYIRIVDYHLNIFNLMVLGGDRAVNCASEMHLC